MRADVGLRLDGPRRRAVGPVVPLLRVVDGAADQQVGDAVTVGVGEEELGPLGEVRESGSALAGLDPLGRAVGALLIARVVAARLGVRGRGGQADRPGLGKHRPLARGRDLADVLEPLEVVEVEATALVGHGLVATALESVIRVAVVVQREVGGRRRVGFGQGRGVDRPVRHRLGGDPLGTAEHQQVGRFPIAVGDQRECRPLHGQRLRRVGGEADVREVAVRVRLRRRQALEVDPGEEAVPVGGDPGLAEGRGEAGRVAGVDADGVGGLRVVGLDDAVGRRRHRRRGFVSRRPGPDLHAVEPLGRRPGDQPGSDGDRPGGRNAGAARLHVGPLLAERDQQRVAAGVAELERPVVDRGIRREEADRRVVGAAAEAGAANGGAEEVLAASVEVDLDADVPGRPAGAGEAAAIGRVRHALAAPRAQEAGLGRSAFSEPASPTIGSAASVSAAAGWARAAVSRANVESERAVERLMAGDAGRGGGSGRCRILRERRSLYPPRTVDVPAPSGQRSAGGGFRKSSRCPAGTRATLEAAPPWCVQTHPTDGGFGLVGCVWTHHCPRSGQAWLRASAAISPSSRTRHPPPRAARPAARAAPAASRPRGRGGRGCTARAGPRRGRTSGTEPPRS